MPVSAEKVDFWYLGGLGRHASVAEEDAWMALSETVPNDKVLGLIVDSTEAANFVDPVVRLYQGAFALLPDWRDPNNDFDTGPQSGFWTNINALRSGMSIADLAQAFVASREFQEHYGSREVTAALITAFYHNVLQRDPESSEIAAWINTGQDAAHILIGFTESTEMKTLTADVLHYWKTATAGGHDFEPLPPPLPSSV
jgi:hypothetical protein